ncbi:hypothetical protein STAFG_2343 [Streptomyces afghaniensis 772]|uniref:Uncharacterized protein n=1 Tax=Streptomyces afghaniensis 772 TaxID=1283301 RepID=S4N1K8_9ACTN|nr:hypothetical protein STAFG_2343 [Streptomyces afghaniensis 772]
MSMRTQILRTWVTAPSASDYICRRCHASAYRAEAEPAGAGKGGIKQWRIGVRLDRRSSGHCCWLDCSGGRAPVPTHSVCPAPLDSSAPTKQTACWRGRCRGRPTSRPQLSSPIPSARSVTARTTRL